MTAGVTSGTTAGVTSGTTAGNDIRNDNMTGHQERQQDVTSGTTTRRDIGNGYLSKGRRITRLPFLLYHSNYKTIDKFFRKISSTLQFS
jgi:hypothetical protein